MEQIIQVQQLNKTYTTEQGKKVLALEDINLDISMNDFVCLVGPSGCGKSTLLKILAGLDSPSSGSAFFQGVAISKPPKISAWSFKSIPSCHGEQLLIIYL